MIYALVIVVWNMWDIPVTTVMARFPDEARCEAALTQAESKYHVRITQKAPLWFCSAEYNRN